MSFLCTQVFYFYTQRTCMIWCLLCCCTFGATQFSSLEFGAIILNTHLATKKNVQKIQVFLLLDLVTFLLIGEQHLSFLYYLICREERSFCASCPSGVPSCTRLLGHQLGLGLMRNPLASPCCNPTLSHSRAAGGEVQLGDRTGEKGAGIPVWVWASLQASRYRRPLGVQS